MTLACTVGMTMIVSSTVRSVPLACSLLMSIMVYDLEGQGISGGQSVADAVAKSWGQDDLTVDQLMFVG